MPRFTALLLTLLVSTASLAFAAGPAAPVATILA